MYRLLASPRFLELLRWGFLVMLPAAIVGSLAAWPGFRTLSLFRILYMLLSLGAIAWLLLNRRFPSNVHVKGFLFFLAFWILWSLVSLVWAADKPAGIRYFIFLIMMASIAVGTVLAVNNAKSLRVALLLLFMVFGFALSVALLEISTDFRLPTSMLVGLDERYQWAVTSIFHNQNDFATYIALWLPFLLAAPFFTQRVGVVLTAVAGILLAIICFAYTGSRTNLLAFALSVVSLLAVAGARFGSAIKSRRLLPGLIVLLGAVVVMCLSMRGLVPVLPVPDIGVQHWRFDTLASEVSAGAGSGGSRIAVIEGGLQALRDSYFLGVGPGNAEHYLQHVTGLDRAYNLHNWWMEVLVNGGILVFVGYLLFYAALLGNLVVIAVRTRRQLLAFTATSLFAALMGYVFGSLSPSSAIHFAPMWIHFGLSLAVINMERTYKADAQT
jgi:teichuronic acid biosynthesis protein TuaE